MVGLIILILIVSMIFSKPQTISLSSIGVMLIDISLKSNLND